MTSELDKERRYIHRNSGGSLMSDTKWRILLGAVQSSELDVQQMHLKFIDIEEVKTCQSIWLDDSRPRSYVDSLEWGAFSLVGIEWLEFPKVAVFPRGPNIPNKEHAQDTVAIRAAIERTGKTYRLEETDTGLRVIGHTRRQP